MQRGDAYFFNAFFFNSTQLENKYVGELTEAKRAAEALSTQCAAQSSLVAALKMELDRANAVVTQQRQSLQMAKEQAAIELQHAHDEAEHLRDDVARLQRHIAGASVESVLLDHQPPRAVRLCLSEYKVAIDGAHTRAADLHSDLAAALDARAAAEAGRVRAQDSYARMYTAVRVLVKAWRLERVERQNADATSATVGGSR